jgi:hypothetical protein
MSTYAGVGGRTLSQMTYWVFFRLLLPQAVIATRDVLQQCALLKMTKSVDTVLLQIQLSEYHQ